MMKKTKSTILVLLAALLLTGCVGAPKTEQTGGTSSTLKAEQADGDTAAVSFTGVVTQRFTEGGGTDQAEVLALETDSGETVCLTLLEGTVLQNGDVAVGDHVTVESEAHDGSDYYPALTVTKVKEPVEVTSPDAPYARIRLTLPEGWQAEETEFDLESEAAGEFGVVFWPEEAPEFQVSLNCYAAFGLCGTGVTIEDITLPGGQAATTYTEGGDVLSLYLCYQDTPGNYVALYQGSKALWEQYEDAVLSILGGAKLGVEGVLSEGEAIERVKDRCTIAYEDVYGRFDVADGSWEVTFYGENEREYFRVNADGTVETVTVN